MLQSLQAYTDWKVRPSVHTPFENELKVLQEILQQQHSPTEDTIKQGCACVVQLIIKGHGFQAYNVLQASKKNHSTNLDVLVAAFATVFRCAGQSTKNVIRQDKLSNFIKTPAMLFDFLHAYRGAESSSSGWGRRYRKAVAEWYFDQDPDTLSNQQCGKGWTHRDVLRLAHPRPRTPDQKMKFEILKSRLFSPEPSLSRIFTKSKRHLKNSDICNSSRMNDCRMLLDKPVLICSNPNAEFAKDVKRLCESFCGRVYSDNFKDICVAAGELIFFIGDFKDFNSVPTTFDKSLISIIRHLSFNYEEFRNQQVNVDEVPLHVHRVGVFIKSFFDNKKDHFQHFVESHAVQSLTESNKSDKSHRKGLLLSNVGSNSDDNGLNFNLLRCSTNFDGPTENFKDFDDCIIRKVHTISRLLFPNSASFNHVLAQIYENSASEFQKDKKAAIKSHADKTKDMPSTGLIAFCTFYCDKIKQNYIVQKKDDWCYKNGSILTRLRFRLKRDVDNRSQYKENFDVTLFPNSLFMIPLTTNRLYTHEIIPSTLPAEFLPSRLGYVIRCSKTKAIYEDGATSICCDDGARLKMHAPSDADRRELKELYFKENTTDKLIDYGRCLYSLNEGDYLEPVI